MASQLSGLNGTTRSTATMSAKKSAADHGDQGKYNGPARRRDEVDDIDGAEFADHRLGLLTKTAQ